MFKPILFFIFSCFLLVQASAQTVDTLKDLYTKVSALSGKVDVLAKQLQDTAHRATAQPLPKSCAEQDFGAFQTFLILAPYLFFVVVIWLIARRLKKTDFSLSEALSAKGRSLSISTTKTVDVQGNMLTQTNEETATDQPVRSASRTIAFFTAVTAMIIVIVLTGYTGYQMVSGCGKEVNLDGLWKILLALGIGVIPYGANVLNGNTKEGTAGTITRP
jgi:hypothetical protein